MAVCEVHMGSGHALQRMTSFMAIVPEGMPGPFPVLYLLHGLSDDHTVWTRRTSIERYLDGIPLMVVMPNGERSWYTDSANNPMDAFETFIARDLIGFVDNAFNTVSSREGRAIAGLSMGGYGAFKLALKHPDLFCAAASFSGALTFDHFDEHGEQWQKEMTLIFGGDPRGVSEDISSIIQKMDKDEIPPLWIDCGDDDFLIEANRKTHGLLDSLDIQHSYMERPGVHNWAYWDDAIRLALPFITGAVGLIKER